MGEEQQEEAPLCVGEGVSLDLGDLRKEEWGRLIGMRLLGCHDNQRQGSLSSFSWVLGRCGHGVC